MIVELRGVEFVNKGAELMLYAIINKVKSEVPGVKFVMAVNSRSPKKKLRELRILVKSNFVRLGINLELLFNLLPDQTRFSLGFATSKDIDVVLDGSGFAFGDKWGAIKAGHRSANHIEKWKKEGKKVILLPQAFGPFTSNDLIEKMKIILANADMVMARDSISYQYLIKISQEHSKIFQYPDFTNLIMGIAPIFFDMNSCQIAIIPNQKMRETQDVIDNDSYPLFLKMVIEILQKKEEKPFFLIHENDTDLVLANEINNLLTVKIPIINEDNSLVVKGIIGLCKGVVSSRFHGLVSALSQSIPCLATGWSHKYEMLFKDYDFIEGLCSVHDSKNILEEKLDIITNQFRREVIKGKLKIKSKEQKQLTEEMWKRVFKLIN